MRGDNQIAASIRCELSEGRPANIVPEHYLQTIAADLGLHCDITAQHETRLDRNRMYVFFQLLFD